MVDPRRIGGRMDFMDQMMFFDSCYTNDVFVSKYIERVDGSYMLQKSLRCYLQTSGVRSRRSSVAAPCVNFGVGHH